MKTVRSIFVVIVFGAIGLLAFCLTALTSGEPWMPAWEKGNLTDVLLWAYERASINTVIALFVLALLSAWLMPFNKFLAAISLALFYPTFSALKVLVGLHTGNLVPFEFVGYGLFFSVCLLGYGVGRWVSKRMPKTA